LNPCTNKAIDTTQRTKQYIQECQIKTYNDDKYYPAYGLTNKIIKIDKSDYQDKTYATHRIDRVQTGTHIEYVPQNTSGWIGSKPIECKTQVPVVVPTMSDIYVPTAGNKVRMIAIWQYFVNECKCTNCNCGNAEELAQQLRLEDEAAALRPKPSKYLFDEYCCCTIF